jgi:ComF family protein
MSQSMSSRQRTNNPVKTIFAAAHDYIFPPLCIICDAPRRRSEAWLCAACIKKLSDNIEKRARYACPCCGQNTRRVRCSCDPRSHWSNDIESVFSIFDFDATVKKLLHQTKYRGMKSLSAWIGAAFSDRIPLRVLGDIDGMVPIPLHKKREKARGYNQSFMFSQGVATVHHSIPVLPPVIKRVRNTVTQTSLNRDRRSANMEGAFALTPELVNCVKGKRVLLIDDVVTTGVTTKEAAKVLRAGGCVGVKVLSIARD